MPGYHMNALLASDIPLNVFGGHPGGGAEEESAPRCMP